MITRRRINQFLSSQRGGHRLRAACVVVLDLGSKVTENGAICESFTSKLSSRVSSKAGPCPDRRRTDSMTTKKQTRATTQMKVLFGNWLLVLIFAIAAVFIHNVDNCTGAYATFTNVPICRRNHSHVFRRKTRQIVDIMVNRFASSLLKCARFHREAVDLLLTLTRPSLRPSQCFSNAWRDSVSTVDIYICSNLTLIEIDMRNGLYSFESMRC